MTVLSENDLVTIDPSVAKAVNRGVVYRVAKILKVNVDLVRADGQPGRVRVHPSYIVPASAADSPIDTTGKPNGVTVTAVPFRRQFHPGEVVTCSLSLKGQAPNTLFVVTRDGGGDRVQVAKLGGDAGRYWRLPANSLTVRTVGVGLGGANGDVNISATN